MNIFHWEAFKEDNNRKKMDPFRSKIKGLNAPEQKWERQIIRFITFPLRTFITRGYLCVFEMLKNKHRLLQADRYLLRGKKKKEFLAATADSEMALKLVNVGAVGKRCCHGTWWSHQWQWDRGSAIVPSAFWLPVSTNASQLLEPKLCPSAAWHGWVLFQRVRGIAVLNVAIFWCI